VLGLGYIGLPTASTFATQGLKVVGVDVNQAVVDRLKNGDVHILEPGLRTLVQAAFGSGNLVVRSEPVEADAFMIAVPTPFYEDKRADMRYVRTATEMILPYLRKGNLVVLESTSPPRTIVDLVAPILEQSGMKAGEDFYLVYSPERVLPGQILRELIENARVIGGVNRASAEAGRDLYSLFVRGEIYLTDATTAEMVKLMENTTRDISIAIANEFSRLADFFNIDVFEAIALANKHPRINILNPGVGVGGHCIGVDPWFLVEAAPHLTPLIRTARMVNDSQPAFILSLVQRALHQDIEHKRIAALGLTYKADVDDIRESPAIHVVQLLAEAGAAVRAYEPLKPDIQINGVEICKTLGSALADADLILVLVGHRQFINLSPNDVAVMTSSRLVIDIPGVWQSAEWNKFGFTIHRLRV